MVASCFNGIDTTGVLQALLQLWCYSFAVLGGRGGGGNYHDKGGCFKGGEGELD